MISKKIKNKIEEHLSHLKKNFSLSTPIIITQLGIICINLFDNLMVGKLGKKALSAISLANSTIFIIVIFGLGISSTIPSLITPLDAKKKYNDGLKILYHGLIINFVLSILMFGSIYIFFHILPYIGQPKEIINDTISFLQVISFSLIPWMVFEILRKFSEGLYIIYPNLIIIWISSMINIILNYLLINGFLYFPKLGFIGVAYSTLISRTVMLIASIITLYRYKKIKKYLSYFKSFVINKEYIKKILKIGIPSGLSILFEMGAFSISSFISGKNGINYLSAHQVIINLISSTFLINTAFSIVATVRISHNFALKRYKKLREIGNSVIFIGLCFMSICSIFFIIFKNDITCLFIKNPKDYLVIPIAEKMIIIASGFQIADGIQGIILGILRGLKDVKIPMCISFFSYWVISIPTILLLNIKLLGPWKGLGVWIGLSIGIITSCILLFIRYNFLIKKITIKYKKKII